MALEHILTCHILSIIIKRGRFVFTLALGSFGTQGGRAGGDVVLGRGSS